MHVLSKSTYIRSLQCQKSLYLYKNYYDQSDPINTNQQLIFNRGHKVGELAHKLFPGGIDVSPTVPWKWGESAEKTKDLIKKGHEIIYEAAFIHHGVLAAIDILVKNENDWFAYEVKSTLEIKDIHIRDASLQYYIISSSGLNLADIGIVHINREFKKDGDINPAKFFKINSVLRECKKELQFVEDNINKAKKTLGLKEIPKIEIGLHCYKPYQCSYIGTCWKNIKRPNIFDLEKLDLETKFEWYDKGIKSFDEILHFQKITKLQRTQILSLSKKNELIDKKQLSNYFSSFTYPNHFIDFRFLQSAIPTFKGGSPFKKTIFSYSMDSKDVFDNVLHTQHFMAEHGYNPFPHLLKSLLENVQPLGDIFILNKDETLKVLQTYFDSSVHSSAKFDSFIDRAREFSYPFAHALYYHPNLKSDSGIPVIYKQFLKTPNKEIEHFKTDEEASSAYENLSYESDILKIAKTSQNLHQYSISHAKAMFEIYEHLKNLLNQ